MKISFLGSGAWATALANVIADNGHESILYGIMSDEIDDINNNHRNSKYFEDIEINPNVKATLSLNEACDSADVIVVAVPSSQIKNVLGQVEEVLTSKPIVVNVAKGFDSQTYKGISETIKDSIDKNKIQGVVSLMGPTFAIEVAKRYYTAICAVSKEKELANKIQQIFSNDYFRVYTNTDETGAEVGAGLKNVIAIASGILEGLGYKDNSRAALITRGLAEITRYGIAKGADLRTFLGLTGIGDLFLTCSSHNSRNYTCGYKIGKDNSSKDFWINNKKTVEGVFACKIIHEEAEKFNLDMPITNAVYEILYNDRKPSEILVELMNRSLKCE